MANENKNNVSLNVGLGINVSEIQKEFNRAVGAFKSFVTQTNKILEKIGNVSGGASEESFSSDIKKRMAQITKDGKALVKSTSNTLNPSYGIFNEETGTYSGGTYKQIAVEAKNASNTIETANKNIEKSNKKTADSFTELRIVGIYGFRSLSRKFGNIIKELSSAGAKLYELNSRFSLIMGDMTSRAEEFADKLGAAYGLNEATIKNNILKLYTLAQNAGIADNEAMRLTETMSRLGVEVASVWDVPIEQATENLISALQGLPRAMKKYGSYVGSTEIKDFFNQYRQAQGLEPLTRELTRQEKTLGVYLKSLSDLGYSFGDFENTINSVENQTRILGETILTLKQIGGDMINTVIAPFLKFFNGFLKVISKMITPLKSLPEGLKKVVGTLMLIVLTAPAIVGTMTLFIYYTTKMSLSLKSLNKHLGESSKRMIVFGKSALKVTKFISSFALLAFGIWSALDAFGVFNKQGEDNKDNLDAQTAAAKTLKRTLSSFDDVNVFKENESDNDSLLGDLDIDSFLDSIDLASDELSNMNDLFAETTNWAKGLSIAIAGIGAVGTIKNIINLVSWIKNSRDLFVKCGNYIATFFAAAWTKFGQIITNVTQWLQANGAAMGAWITIAANLAALVTNIVGLFTKWADMTTGERIVSILTAIASAAFLVGAAIAAISGKYGIAAVLGTAGAVVGAIGSSIAFGAKSANTTVTNVGSNSSAVTSAYNANDTSTNLGTSISNAVMAGMAGVGNSNNKPVNVNINVNVDEEYIYKAYNNVAKQNGVM